MPSAAWSKLRTLLLAEYGDLVARLAQRLGSKDLAGEAVHETFLRIERGGAIGDIRSPRAYLYRMTANIAADQRKANKDRVSSGDSDLANEIVDEAPDPGRIVEARRQIEALKFAIRELPPRRQAILTAAWFEEATSEELAQRFGVSVRMIQMEIKAGLKHCALRLKREQGGKNEDA